MFGTGSYLKVWEVKNKADKYLDARCSTSRKVADGQYETDFSGFVRFVGQAFESMKDAKAGDSVKIVRCGVTNSYVKEKNTTYTNFVVFEVEGGNAQPTNRPSADSFVNVPDSIDEELPFN